MEVPNSVSLLVGRAALCPLFPRARTVNVQTLNCEQETESCIFLSGHFST